MKNPEILPTPVNPQDERSIFGEILDWMLAPLLFLWPISIAVTFYFSGSVADLVYDQALREQLEGVVHVVQKGAGRAEIEQAAGNTLSRTGAAGRSLPTRFRVMQGDGNALAGSLGLPIVSPATWKAPGSAKVHFRDQQSGTQELRVASMVLGDPRAPRQTWTIVEVAETLEPRTQLANKIVASVIMPQFFIIPLAVFLVWFGLKKGLAPLARLRETLGARDPADLSPIASRSVPEELEALVESFNGMLRRMKRNIDSQQRFIADAAHQMRTPLAGLKMQAQLAIRENDPEALRHALRQIANSVDRATRLSHQLLTLARTESGEIGAHKHEPIDLESLLHGSIEEWVMRALEKQIDLGFEAHGEARVLGNAFLLRELVNNLIDNALRYTPPSGLVTGRVTRNGEFIILEVEDSGIGISVEESELVFERFYRVDNANSEGSGLGLAIVREIAAQHGAYAALRPNTKGKGAVARVVFPAWEESGGETEPATPEP